jgi:hypothetical protein
MATQPSTRPSIVLNVPPFVLKATTAPSTAPSTEPSRPVPVALPSDALPPTDQQIGDAIQRGVSFLVGRFAPNTFQLREGMRGFGRETDMHDDAAVLCIYALLQAGQAVNDPRLRPGNPFMAGCLAAMKRYSLTGRYATYSRGLRSTALALYNRKEDRTLLVSDVDSLIRTNRGGAYTYYADAMRHNDMMWDNSNSQYGLLGVWSGAEVDVEVPMAYWQAVEQHWAQCQLYDGSWPYRQNERSRMTMTCAGIASLFVCHDWLDGPKFGAQVGREPYSPALKRGLACLEQGDNAVDLVEGRDWGYALYGVERVALASGFKFFGFHNWYPELALDVIKRQQANGSWEGDVDTAYALLFLSRGRHPVIMNKLRYDGYWANRPRDASNLAKYASQELERPVNWQVVSIDREWVDWADSPILYLSSHVPPAIADADVVKIRNYVLAGGMLFVQADGDSPAMTQFAGDLAHRLFPQFEMADVPDGHALFNAMYKLPDHPPLKMVSNGSRILMLYSPTDISQHWQLREQHTDAGKPFFQLGINMFIYAAGRRDLRNRLDTNVLWQLKTQPSMTIKVARLQYAGPWNPEPYAWARFANWFVRQTNYALDVHMISMRDLDPAVYPFAHLTGTARYNPTPEEIAGVKNYVEHGGMLLIDLTGGAGQFDDSMRKNLLQGAFGDIRPTFLDATSPLLRAGPPGMKDLTQPRLRPFAIERLGANGGAMELYKAGAGHILFTSLDITSGLLNTGTWGIIGYEPLYSQNLMKNAILWTLDGQKD